MLARVFESWCAQLMQEFNFAELELDCALEICIQRQPLASMSPVTVPLDFEMRLGGEQVLLSSAAPCPDERERCVSAFLRYRSSWQFCQMLKIPNEHLSILHSFATNSFFHLLYRLWEAQRSGMWSGPIEIISVFVWDDDWTNCWTNHKKRKLHPLLGSHTYHSSKTLMFELGWPRGCSGVYGSCESMRFGVMCNGLA